MAVAIIAGDVTSWLFERPPVMARGLLRMEGDGVAGELTFLSDRSCDGGGGGGTLAAGVTGWGAVNTVMMGSLCSVTV